MLLDTSAVGPPLLVLVRCVVEGVVEARVPYCCRVFE
jgi:hypothetical protein